MTPRHPSNYDLLADLEANIAHAAWIATVIDDWTGPLRSATTDTGRVTGGDTATPTEAGALRDFDRDAQLATSAQLQLDDLQRLRVIATRMNARRNGTLNRTSLEQAKQSVNERTTPSTVGWCVADDTHCDATDEYHSLKGGLCGACRKAFQRWPRTADPGADRAAFIRARKAEAEEARRHVG